MKIQRYVLEKIRRILEKDFIVQLSKSKHNGLNSDLQIKEFKEMTDEWLDFIIDCRSGKEHAYDIVIGAMADDQIYNYVSDYMDGSITREQFWVLARFKYPTHQINFCTDAALACLEYVTAEEVEPHEQHGADSRKGTEKGQ